MRLLPFLVLAACGSSPTRLELIDEYQQATGWPYIDCGLWEIKSDCSSEPFPAAGLCFLDAQFSCSAAEVTTLEYTLEGAEILTTWLLHPGEGGCSVSAFDDNTADEFAEEPAVVRRSCDSVEQGVSCNPIIGVGCEEVERW